MTAEAALAVVAAASATILVALAATAATIRPCEAIRRNDRRTT